MRYKLCLLLLLLVFLPVGAAFPDDCKEYVTILLYHKFDEPRSPSTSVSSELLRAHLQYLKEHNYNIISIEQFLNYIETGTPIPPKPVIITIDDGYRSVYERAFPVLKEYEAPFTVFLYMEAVDRFPDYMTKAQLREMSLYRGVTFGNHSYSHSRFGRQKDVTSFQRDMQRSEERFLQIFGHRPVLYAYPYGEYNASMVRILKERGYRAAFTQDPFTAGCSTDRFLIPRVPLVGTWARIEKLEEFLTTEPLPVISHTPPFGLLDRNPPDEVSFKLSSLQQYRNFKIYISEIGWLNPEVIPEEGVVRVTGLPLLQREINRVALHAFNTVTRRRARFFFLLIKN